MKWPAIALLLAVNIAFAQPAEPALYRIDPAASDVYWLVYSAGALSGLGHNHVISATTLDGTVRLSPDILNSEFQLQIPVASLQVDDLERRRQLGDDFSNEPSPRAVASTRSNMLSERVLDADRYPVLRIRGTGPLSEPGGQILRLRIEVAGRQVERSVPVEVNLEGSTVNASGNFQLTHEELGLEPYSALLGTLKVAQEMDFYYRVVVHRVDDERLP